MNLLQLYFVISVSTHLQTLLRAQALLLFDALFAFSLLCLVEDLDGLVFTDLQEFSYQD